MGVLAARVDPNLVDQAGCVNLHIVAFSAKSEGSLGCMLVTPPRWSVGRGVACVEHQTIRLLWPKLRGHIGDHLVLLTMHGHAKVLFIEVCASKFSNAGYLRAFRRAPRRCDNNAGRHEP